MWTKFAERKFLHDEICHLKTYFLNNKYPMQIIENVAN